MYALVMEKTAVTKRLTEEEIKRLFKVKYNEEIDVSVESKIITIATNKAGKEWIITQKREKIPFNQQLENLVFEVELYEEAGIYV